MITASQFGPNMLALIVRKTTANVLQESKIAKDTKEFNYGLVAGKIVTTMSIPGGLEKNFQNAIEWAKQVIHTVREVDVRWKNKTDEEIAGEILRVTKEKDDAQKKEATDSRSDRSPGQ